MDPTPKTKPIRIPYDSFVLEAVVRELQEFVGGKIQEIRQPNETDVAFGIYAGGREAMLLLSCHPVFFRAHFVTRRMSTQQQPPQFLSALRSRLMGGRIAQVEQVEGDRILDIVIETGEGAFRLVAEMMGKHSNLVLMDEGGKVVGAAKWVGRSKSSRPIQPGVRYELPPVMGSGGRSKFSSQLAEAGGDFSRLAPVLSPGHGAYPVSVAPLGLPEHLRQSISIALEQHFEQAIPAAEAESLRAALLGQLDRVLLARDRALGDLREAEAGGLRAPQWQRWGELILAYGPSAPAGVDQLQVWDYDGAEVSIKVDPELDFKANANRYFDKAKRAKGRMGLVHDQIKRLSADRADVALLRERVAGESRLLGLKDLQETARKKRWLIEQRLPTKNKEDRPYEGHRIRELAGPGGLTVLYGENAESNDYLTLRVAKPNDYWLHVRGGVSAHVVIQTRNQPDKVQKEALMFAAKVAVQNSPSKHAGFVPVDYTLKKYVRKMKGAPKGTAFYTHEKTLHVEAA